jgi:integrase
MSQSITEEAIDDPVGYFIADMQLHGKSPRTQEAYRRVLTDFNAFLEDGGHQANGKIHLKDASHRDCTAWIHAQRGTVSESTIATYAAYLHRFYAYMQKTAVFDTNPMSIVLEEMDESIDTDPSRRQISVAEMRGFIDTLSHPLDRAVILTLVKTGIRAGELCNLDLRDIAITDDRLDTSAVQTPRGALANRAESLFVSEVPSAGEVYNGTERSASNKRKRDTIIPIDAELRSALVEWLAIRPDARSPADPLFMSTSRWGTRLSPNSVHRIVTTNAEAMGWYSEGASIEENVTPHYFRHFFTTHLRDRIGDRGVVKYLRGDVADDVIETYTHNWDSQVRELYEKHIYSLSSS